MTAGMWGLIEVPNGITLALARLPGRNAARSRASAGVCYVSPMETALHFPYFDRFTKSRKCFACAFSDGMWMYIMWPAS
jgi:hypothetical protein